MWIFLVLPGCQPDDPGDDEGPGITTPPTTSPPPTTTTPEVEVELTLTVDPLVLAAPTAMTVEGATEGSTASVWRGVFGGTSCPTELAGGCLPIGDAVVVATGVADAAGTVATTWDVPAAEPAGGYPVFVATVDDAQSLPVGRRVWDHVPDWPVEQFVDPFDDDIPGTGDDPPALLPPGDWLDLSLESHDTYDVDTLGNQSLTATATFARALWDVLPTFRVPDASDTALLVRNITWSEHTLIFEGRSLVTGTWQIDISGDYGEDQGVYDVSVRVTTPAEPATWYADLDGDGWGDASSPVESATQPDGAVYRSGDCEDALPELNPDAWDVCDDSVDQDCTGTDKPCHAAPVGEALIGAHAALRADVELDLPFDVAAFGDADGDGVAELWIRSFNVASVIPVVPGSLPVPAVVANAAGWGASRIGDFDHDGQADLALGGTDLAPEGAVLITHLPVTPEPLVVKTATWATLVGSPEGSDAGQALDASGDVDGDGWIDLLVGADEANTVWAVTSVPAGESDLDTSAAATFVLADVADEAGVCSAAGDYDGDGISDVTIGTEGPAAFVFRGPVAGRIETSTAADTTLTLPANLAARLSIGDTDGNGLDDLLLSSFAADTAWLFAGPPLGALDSGDAATVITPTYDVVWSHAIGDLDGDGFDDLAVADPYALYKGVVSVVYGPLPASLELPADADLVLWPAEDTTIGQGLWFLDADGDGGDDLVITSFGSLDLLLGLPPAGR